LITDDSGDFREFRANSLLSGRFREFWAKSDDFRDRGENPLLISLLAGIFS
jgi:hypothetical protein